MDFDSSRMRRPWCPVPLLPTYQVLTHSYEAACTPQRGWTGTSRTHCQCQCRLRTAQPRNMKHTCWCDIATWACTEARGAEAEGGSEAGCGMRWDGCLSLSAVSMDHIHVHIVIDQLAKKLLRPLLRLPCTSAHCTHGIPRGMAFVEQCTWCAATNPTCASEAS